MNNIDVFSILNKFCDDADGLVQYKDFKLGLSQLKICLNEDQHLNIKNKLDNEEGFIDLFMFISKFDQRIKNISKNSIEKANKIRIGNILKKQG